VELSWSDVLLDSFRFPGFVSGFWDGLLAHYRFWCLANNMPPRV
jgi:hypothetical protein